MCFMLGHETFYMARFRTTVYLNKARLKVVVILTFKCALCVWIMDNTLKNFT